jgi:ABC-type antimicrobial peptide transport system permease subunit
LVLVWFLPEGLECDHRVSIFLERMTAALSGALGGLALLLAVVGLDGVVAYAVTRRTGEIGIRLALGAARGGVLWMVIRDALVLVTAGLCAGLPLALGAGHRAAALLYGVTPHDPLALGGTVAALLAGGTLAALIPARQAASIEPAQALHHQ